MPQSANSPGFLLGVDTGTSKTHALIATTAGEVLGFGETGCGNYEVVGLEGFITVLSDAVGQAIRMAAITKNQIKAMGFGISGFDWASEEPKMHEAIKTLGINCTYQITNDVTVGLIAGTSEGWGVAVDAGTGNNVRGRDRTGRLGRITGNSVWCGEIGGGGEMVWLATIAVIHAWTSRGPQTKLTQLFMDFAEIETEFDLIEGIATDQINLPPILAEEIFRLAAEGDQVAGEIVNTSAIELAENVNAVIRQLDLQTQPFEIVLIGSIFKAGEPYLKPFRQAVQAFAPSARLIQLSVPPVVGAVLLAAESSGINPHSIRQALIDSLNDFVKASNQ